MIVVSDKSLKDSYISDSFLNSCEVVYNRFSNLDKKYNLDRAGTKTFNFDIKYKFQQDNSIVLNQKHTNKIITPEEYFANKNIEADGIFWSSELHEFVPHSIRTADCVPVHIFSLYDNYLAVVSLHVGWKGFTKGIIENGLDLLKKSFLTKFKNYKGSEESIYQFMGVNIGPAIFGINYECGEDVKQAIVEHQNKFNYKHWYEHKSLLFKEDLSRNKVYPDLQLLIASNLLERNIASDSIALLRKNTYTSKLLPSYRRACEQGTQENLQHIYTSINVYSTMISEAQEKALLKKK